MRTRPRQHDWSASRVRRRVKHVGRRGPSVRARANWRDRRTRRPMRLFLLQTKDNTRRVAGRASSRARRRTRLREARLMDQSYASDASIFS
eukprot:126164-Prorocentrum_minimum.AAC.3